MYGHHHLNVTSVEATKKFLVDALGGTAIRIGENRAEVVRFPNVLIFMRAQAPKGGSKGTSVDHIGFAVPDLGKAVDRIKQRLPHHHEHGNRAAARHQGGHRVPPDGVTGNSIAFAMGPDDLKVELVETPQQATPIALHHVHFLGQQNNESHLVRENIGAEARPATNFPTAVLPAVSLLFSLSTTPVPGTQGRALDHIGFEVSNLEAFLTKLAASGIKLDIAYRSTGAQHCGRVFHGSLGDLRRADRRPGPRHDSDRLTIDPPVLPCRGGVLPIVVGAFPTETPAASGSS